GKLGGNFVYGAACGKTLQHLLFASR
ncbi:hypothetical protein NA66_10071, partial [Burkholderia pyrrocinia]